MKDNLRKLLLVICIGIFAFSVFKLGSIYFEYEEIDKETEETVEEYVEQEIVVEENKNNNKKEEVEDNTDWHAVAMSRKVNFDKLLAKNSDVVGWIYIPNTRIDEPLLRGETNDDYIKTNVNGKKSAAGSIFIDSANTGTLLDRNTIIHGHNMKSGARFHNLRYYLQSSFFKKRDKIYIYLPDGSINVYDVMASDKVSCYSDLYTTGYSIYTYYVKAIKKGASQFRDLGDEAMPLIMLSTCYDAHSDERYIVYGKLSENVKPE